MPSDAPLLSSHHPMTILIPDDQCCASTQSVQPPSGLHRVWTQITDETETLGDAPERSPKKPKRNYVTPTGTKQARPRQTQNLNNKKSGNRKRPSTQEPGSETGITVKRSTRIASQSEIQKQKQLEDTTLDAAQPTRSRHNSQPNSQPSSRQTTGITAHHTASITASIISCPRTQ